MVRTVSSHALARLVARGDYVVNERRVAEAIVRRWWASRVLEPPQFADPTAVAAQEGDLTRGAGAGAA